jgi:hypothetical protein
MKLRYIPNRSRPLSGTADSQTAADYARSRYRKPGRTTAFRMGVSLGRSCVTLPRSTSGEMAHFGRGGLGSRRSPAVAVWQRRSPRPGTSAVLLPTNLFAEPIAGHHPRRLGGLQADSVESLHGRHGDRRAGEYPSGSQTPIFSGGRRTLARRQDDWLGRARPSAFFGSGEWFDRKAACHLSSVQKSANHSRTPL